ncbi:hypothetical protein [Azospirillum soli]|uniref:hypothetical protein n=1 Tax=Azospirillum soli TaxID=1304799 RepID=UPI001AE6D9E6|nr:hypothetical protein [Azospirillum soli]MBP2314301.1 hypothetical protein [Azospirillum soli]
MHDQTTIDAPLGGAANPQPGRDVFAYEPRRLTADPVLEVGGFRLKPYRIAFPDPAAEQAVQAHDLRRMLAAAVAPESDPNYHGLGFAVLHQARDGIYLLVGRWYAGNNLQSESYQVTVDGAGGVSLVRLKLFACIWEMAVYGFERDSWVATTMASGRGVDGAEAYLQCRLEGWI